MIKAERIVKRSLRVMRAGAFLVFALAFNLIM